MNKGHVYGGTEFNRLVAEAGHGGVNNQQIQVMESRGVIAPIKSSAGWRLYSWEDVLAARAWIAKNVVRRPRHRETATAC